MSFGLLEAFKKERWKRRFQGGAIFSAVFFSIILLAFLLLQFFGYGDFRPYSKTWKVVMAINGILLLVILSIWSTASRKVINQVFLFGMAPLFLFFIFHFVIPDATVEAKAPGLFLEQHISEIDADAVIIADEDSLKSVCWYWRRNDVNILGAAGELDYGVKYQDAACRFHDMESASALIERNRGKTILITRVKDFSGWRNRLPQPLLIFESNPLGYVLSRY
jgi:4-amino-4-deoxy-L-arabinose transferase